ncbi:MAG: pyruvate, phosphate dikinase [Chloroflexi bacterium]|nr:pyruvate, phosphate dikinase [Chloroflexota bacterium]MDA1146466.1 pyruvate, phosphate dikinase [Chloroflexota bacterium]
MTTAAEEPGVATRSEKLVYLFGDGQSDGHRDLRNLLGGKGAGLAEMSSLGIPVPPGFTITTDVCNAYYALGRSYPEALEARVREGMTHVEQLVGTRFGDPENPLLISVRSGARVSMPGMMDTILNLGLNDATAEGLARRSGNARFAFDSYRRFVQMYGDVVLGVGKNDDTDTDPYEHLLESKKRSRGVTDDTALDADALRELVAEYKALIRERGQEFPDDPWDQLWGAVGAVFESWENPRAVVYRDQYGYPASWGTAVNVQAMVFGNLGDDCATGVLFTRNPSTGQPRLFGEFLVNAQGEDVVAGTRTPQPILAADRVAGAPPSLEEAMPAVYEELALACDRLEHHFGDMQDIEFTVQQQKLWILQTRGGKRAGLAMLKIAVDLVDEGVLTEREAVARLDPEQLDELLHPVFVDGAVRNVIAHGLAASPGAAVGTVVFRPIDVVAAAARGESTILVRDETSPEDIEGMVDARGILTARGGMTSHAAVVARGMGKCCVTGCTALQIEYAKRQFTVKTAEGETVIVREGDTISLDGTTGEVMLGALPLMEAQFPPEFDRIMGWVDAARRMRVRANADTPEDAARARAFGAEGIGLCRTEHMFFGADRILAVRQMILAEDTAARRDALTKILPMQREDFIGILRAMAPYPVTIRLLDPPLHEFLPHEPAEIEEVAKALGLAADRVQRRVDSLREQNPMLGHRGVRLGVTSPEIYEVQVRAVIEAACLLAAEGLEVTPEIMIPLVGMPDELRLLRERTVAVAEQVMGEQGRRVHYSIGTMIELPRACVVADQIAEHADFFSFGTNDLTQTAFGLSRDDAGRFLPAYLDQHIIDRDPFVVLDREGVGGLIELGIARGKSARPNLKIGICGEHGGDPSSIEFCEQHAFDYVSCSPFRVPIARLAAAQAAIKG